MGVPAVRIIDGNEAAASVAYRLIDVAAISHQHPSTVARVQKTTCC